MYLVGFFLVLIVTNFFRRLFMANQRDTFMLYALWSFHHRHLVFGGYFSTGNHTTSPFYIQLWINYIYTKCIIFA